MTARTLASILLILAAVSPAAAQTKAGTKPAASPHKPAASPAKPAAPATQPPPATPEPTTGDDSTPVPSTVAAKPAASKPAAPVAADTPAPTPVDPNKRIVGFDLMSATVMQEKQSSFSGLAARLRLTIPRTIPGIEVLPTVEYWRNSTTLTPYDIKGTRVDATIGGDIRYAFHAGAWHPYLGAGYGIHFLSTQVNAPSQNINNASDSVIMGGLAALGGITFPLTERIDNFLEVKYHHIPGYKQVKINWGISIGL